MYISKKDGGKEHPFMKTDKRETKGRERERETDMCGSSQRKPLEARLLNYAQMNLNGILIHIAWNKIFLWHYANSHW